MFIRAEGNFSVVINEPPPEIGTGLFSIAKNQLTDFEFSMLGFTWDVTDASLLALTFEGDLYVIAISFEDEQGAGELLWDFRDSTFQMDLNAGGFSFVGNSDSGAVTSAFSDFEHSISVAEPGTALLLGLSLILLSRFARR